jgi:hypothetical protein
MFLSVKGFIVPKKLKTEDDFGVFDGPLVLFDHRHIQSPEQASRFKTGDLQLPGKAAKKVDVSFFCFQHNNWQKRADAVFSVFVRGDFKGHFFASAFKSLSH